mmetsp:Transcript_33376/g.85273  ORF Transcript_33376/g.85273 Transcript_33376/m.85273 type:complete len:219 (+) Transcript_33376:407-1063(+)
MSWRPKPSSSSSESESSLSCPGGSEDAPSPTTEPVELVHVDVKVVDGIVSMSRIAGPGLESGASSVRSSFSLCAKLHCGSWHSPRSGHSFVQYRSGSGRTSTVVCAKLQRLPFLHRPAVLKAHIFVLWNLFRITGAAFVPFSSSPVLLRTASSSWQPLLSSSDERQGSVCSPMLRVDGPCARCISAAAASRVPRSTCCRGSVIAGQAILRLRRRSSPL